MNTSLGVVHPPRCPERHPLNLSVWVLVSIVGYGTVGVVMGTLGATSTKARAAEGEARHHLLLPIEKAYEGSTSYTDTSTI